MTMSEAKKRANKKWNDDHPYERIGLIVKEGKKAEIQAAADRSGSSLNGYIVQAIKERMERESK